jgi:hypothetical protein
MHTSLAESSLLDRTSPAIRLLALVGMPVAGAAAILGGLQIPRLFYGEASPLVAAAEVASLAALVVLWLSLRAALRVRSAPSGFYRDVLDFLALEQWHPAVKFALAVVLVLPPALYLHGQFWLLPTLLHRGRAALASGDVRDALDGLVAAIQLPLIGGVPLVFTLHMLSRWKPKRRLLPWLLLPIVFIGTAMVDIFIVFSRMH